MAAVPTLSETASSACGAAVVSVVAGARISDGREMRGGGGRGSTCGICDQRPQGDLRPPHTHLTPRPL